MTVICCYETTKEYWIGSDTAGSADDFITNVGTKIFSKNNYIVGFAISLRAGNIIEELEDLPKDIKNIEDFRTFRDCVMLAMIEKGGCSSVSQESDSTFMHPLELIVISPYGAWTMGPDYQINEIIEKYCSIGSGELVATGALFFAAINNEPDGEHVIKTSLSAAIKHIGNCSGDCCIMKLNKKKARKKRR